jgi:hypothetical protein
VSPTQPPVPVPPPAGTPATREIPLTQGGSAGAIATVAPQATGPVDYVPGPPAAPPTAEAPAVPGGTREFVVDLSDEPRERRSGAGVRAAALLLGVVAAVVLEIGLLLHGGTTSLWSGTPLWSAFASVAVVAGLAGVAARLAGNRPWARPVALAGSAGLAVFWLLVVLPVAATDRGFVLTAALGCLLGALWTAGRAQRG